MMNRRLAIFLALGFGCLASAVGFQFWDAWFHPVVITKSTTFEEAIPTEVTGWTSEELPLAQTPQVANAAFNRLNFNDFFSRIYHRGSTRLTVYVAYWEPLQMPVRQVGSHTPDVCWVLNGWECDAIRNDVLLPFGDGVLKSAELREFLFRGNREYVAYWHLINGRVFKAQNRVGMWDRWNMLTDQIRFGLNQKPEQYFVRISSNRPLESLWEDPGVQELLRAIVEAVQLDVPPGDDPGEWTYQFLI